MMNQEQQVMEWIEDHQEEILEFLQQLIQIPSVNPWFFDEPGPSREKEVQEFISRKLESLGAETEMWEPDADELKQYEGMAGYYPGRDFTGRPNLAATFGKEHRVSHCCCSVISMLLWPARNGRLIRSKAPSLTAKCMGAVL
jgi:acetylornithine deacetylase